MQRKSGHSLLRRHVALPSTLRATVPVAVLRSFSIVLRGKVFANHRELVHGEVGEILVQLRVVRPRTTIKRVSETGIRSATCVSLLNTTRRKRGRPGRHASATVPHEATVVLLGQWEEC